MANKNIFKSNPGNVKDANVKNDAGGAAYALSDKAALTTYALTGTLYGTFYASGEDQLKKVLELANNCELDFVAKLAVYSRQYGYMKDMPALLTAFVATKSSELLRRIFHLTITDPKMLRNYVQIMRSGVVGRKSLGSASKKLIQNYICSLSDEQLFKADVGNSPSLQDILKLSHPKPDTVSKNALFAYLLGKEYSKEAVLPLVNSFESFKKDTTQPIPNVPFQMLTALELTDDHWKQLAKRATWNQMRMNLNAFARHSVFNDREVVDFVANKLSNPEEVRRARVFPYQLFSTFLNLEDNIPAKIKLAIQAAAEISIENVPAIEGDVVVALDVSGSMKDPITGRRGNVSTKMRCIDVAGLFAAALVRKNPLTKVIPFDTAIKDVNINPLDSVMTNAQKLADSGRNGGTDCSVPIAYLNQNNIKSNIVFMISDNQSWISNSKIFNKETPMMREWSRYAHAHKGAKLVCLDIAPYGNSQVYDTTNTLNVAGFSDQVFDVVKSFAMGETADVLVNKVNGVAI